MGLCCSSENKEYTENEIDLACNTSESTIADKRNESKANATTEQNELERKQTTVVELLDTFVGGLPSDFTFSVPQHTLSKIAPQLALHTSPNANDDTFNVNFPKKMESMSEIEVKDTLTAMIERYYSADNIQTNNNKQRIQNVSTHESSNKYNIRVSIQGKAESPTSCRIHLTPVGVVDTLTTIVEKQHKNGSASASSPTATETFASISSSASTCVSPTTTETNTHTMNPMNGAFTPSVVHITVTPIQGGAGNENENNDEMRMMKQYNNMKRAMLGSPLSKTMTQTTTLQAIHSGVGMSPSETLDTMEAAGQKLEFQSIDCTDLNSPISTGTVVAN